MKCPECNKVYGLEFYCKSCNYSHFRNNIPNWTSGDDTIDKFIQGSQLNAAYESKLLEWIEYSALKDIKHIAEGGFGSVFKGVWKDGPITHRWKRDEQISYC